MYLITPSQCRAARALLNWSQPELAAKCDVHVQTISGFEQETTTPTKRTLEKIAITIDFSGIELMPQDGVRRKAGEVKTYKGDHQFGDFYTDVYNTISQMGGEICVSNVSEAQFSHHHGPGNDAAHVKKMQELSTYKKFNFRILIKDGDTNFIASSYAQYRWLESKYFHTVPFYVYGNKLAIIHFKEEVTIHVVENKDIADAQRIQFNVFWESAKIPDIKKGD